MKCLTLIFFSIWFNLQAQEIIINEIMPSNVNSIIDEDGDTPDWIELYNSSNFTIDLSSYYLSDNNGDLTKWRLPNISLSPKQIYLIFASGKDRRSNVVKWGAVIDRGESWKYILPNAVTSNSWRDVNFDDTSWSSGSSGIGYGDDDDATVIPATMSLYMRKKFTLDSLNGISGLFFNMDYDDGFAAYLNGTEIARENLGVPGEFPLFNQPADAVGEPLMAYGIPPIGVNLNRSLNLLRVGENVLAVEVHNININSSDLTAIPFLTLGFDKLVTGLRTPDPLLNLSYPKVHTNFSLKTGETLYLYKSSQIIDSVSIPRIPVDYSYGRDPADMNIWNIFDNPTPGVMNGNDGYSGVTGKPEFNFRGGVYSSSLSIELNKSAANDNIYFTTDGSLPDKSSYIYDRSFMINKSIVIKAKSYSPGLLPSEVVTETFILNKNTDLPVISVSTDPANLWDSDSGIYVMGKNAEKTFPFFGANFWQDWEKQAYFEFIDESGEKKVGLPCGIKIFGTYSRGLPEKSLALFFRSRYGAKELNYQIFPELPYKSYTSLVLRNSGNDWDITMLRDGLLQSIADGLNLEHQAYRPAVVYLNGEYWGIHNIREKVNEDFLSLHKGVVPAEVDLLELDGQILEGSNENYLQMMDYIRASNMSDNNVLDSLSKLMDIDNFIDYQIAEIYFDNTDWPGNNIKYWRDRHKSKKWRWILFDTDFGFGIWDRNAYRNNTLEFALEDNGPDWPNPKWSTYMLRALLRNSRFSEKFINRFADLSNTLFKEDRVYGLINSISKTIENEIPSHIDKWNSFDLTQWRNNIKNLKTFASFRLPFVRSHFINHFGLGGSSFVTLKVNGEGNIKINSLLIDKYPWKGIYFKNNNITLQAFPKFGYKFIGWKGAVNSNSPLIKILPGESFNISAQFEKITDETNIVINEINYHSSKDFDSKDWVEIYNTSDIEIDISGWKFTDSNIENGFLFPQGSLMPENSFYVVCRDTSAFDSLYPAIENRTGNMNFNLSNGGEYIQLIDAAANLVDSLTYDDKFPWPEEPDGDGFTLALLDPFSDNSLALSWAASPDYGTPGRPNNFTSTEKLHDNLPDDYKLYQNYPNPFNPSTTIKFSIPVNSLSNDKITSQNGSGVFVSLVVYNILGKKVAELVSSEKTPGYYSVNFNASNLSSGVYLYKLSAGSFTAVNKMLLVK